MTPVKVNPGWAAVALVIPVVGLINTYNTRNRSRQAQATAGRQAEAFGLLGRITSIFPVLDIHCYSSQLHMVRLHA